MEENMKSWHEVKDFIKSKYPIKSEEEKSLFINFTTTENRSHLVQIFLFNSKFFGEWVSILSPIGNIPAAKVGEALTALDILPIGGIVKSGNDYALRDSMRLSEATPNRLIEEIELIVTSADYFEDSFIGVDKY
jgi:hypothetical protein